MERNWSTFEVASSLLMERFPELGFLASSWQVEPIQEEVFPALHPGKAEVFYFYGLGIGEAFSSLRKWLEEKGERELIFLEDQTGRLASFLQMPQAIEILSHPQVHLALLPPKGSLENSLENLAKRYPVDRMEIAALPSYRTRRFQVLRLKLLRKTALSQALHNDRIHGYQPFENFLKNLSHLPHSFYANGWQNAFQGIPAIICGAGPSLQPTMELLKKLENRAICIAGGSTLAALSSQGLTPHFGMAVDPNLEEYRRLKNSFAFEVPLLYSTRVCPSVFQTCNGPFGYMRSGIGGVPEIWLEEELGLLDPLIGQNLSSESISVTTICVAWAQFLGCNPILLNGVDLAYTGNRHYAAGVTEEQALAFQEIDAEKAAADRIVKRKDRHGKPIYTAVRWLMESAALSHYAKEHPQIQFLNTTEGGLGFADIPYLSLQEAADTFLQKEYDLTGQIHRKIALTKMPEQTKERIAQKIREMKESLDRVVVHLMRLAEETKTGSSVLAEFELKEEIAYLYLFYDADEVLQQALLRTHRSWAPSQSAKEAKLRSQEKEREKWKRFLNLARQYQSLWI